MASLLCKTGDACRSVEPVSSKRLIWLGGTRGAEVRQLGTELEFSHPGVVGQRLYSRLRRGELETGTVCGNKTSLRRYVTAQGSSLDGRFI